MELTMFTESLAGVASHVDTLAIFSWSAYWSAYKITFITVIIFPFTVTVFYAFMVAQICVMITNFTEFAAMIIIICIWNARGFAYVIIWVTFVFVFTVSIKVAT